MQTTSEITLRALRRIGVVASDEPATADQTASGLDALNEIGQSFRVNGVHFDMPILGHATQIPIDSPCLAAFQTILAARLAEEFGQPGPDPAPAWAQIAAHYYEPVLSSLFELTRTASQRRRHSHIMCPGFTGAPPIPTPPTPIIPTAWTDATPWVDAAAWDDSIQWSI